MPEKYARREDVALSLEWLEDVSTTPTVELRKRRDDCRDLETEFSYARRLLQGKIDILTNELKSRSEGGEADTEDLVRRLPSILAGESPGGGGPKRLLKQELPANAGKYRRRRERLAAEIPHVASASVQELTRMLEELVEEERRVSQDRRKAQQIVDTVNAELVRRYRDGEEDPSALLSP
ncbi:MAG: aerial mycelium formation protein [Actinobacteria bacterium]|nr:aerial mycelium formation protein [Actinomycetota bacterium]